MKTDESWRKAAEILGIRVKAPFVFSSGQRNYVCVAHVPDFGGRGGTLVMETTSPTFETDHDFAADAAAEGYCWSFLNAESYAVFDEKQFKETLLEWGFTGLREHRPTWLTPSFDRE